MRPGGTIYYGSRDPNAGGPVTVYVQEPGGKRRKLRARRDLWNHSPDGFQWGYGGSGPAQLALALLADATGDDAFAVRHRHDFKFAIIAMLPAAWKMTAHDIRKWAAHTKEHADA